MKIKILLFTAVISTSLAFASGNADSLKYDILLDSKLMTDLGISGNLIHSYEITSARNLLLATSSQFYLLGWGNIVPFGNPAYSIHSFAFTPDSVLLVVRNNELCTMNEDGDLSVMYNLPNRNTNICAGKNVMYLYEGAAGQDKYALYMLARGGKYTKLLELPHPINAVREYNDMLYLAVDNALLQFDLKGRSLNALTVLSPQETINSLVLNPEDGRLFFTAGSNLYTLNDNSIVIITGKLGGYLNYMDGLIIFNPAQNLIIQLRGLNNQAVSKTSPLQPDVPLPAPLPVVLTNSQIIELTQAGLSEEVIISIIEHSATGFSLSADDIIDLYKHNVPSPVISAMREAAKRQTQHSDQSLPIK